MNEIGDYINRINECNKWLMNEIEKFINENWWLM